MHQSWRDVIVGAPTQAASFLVGAALLPTIIVLWAVDADGAPATIAYIAAIVVGLVVFGLLRRRAHRN